MEMFPFVVTLSIAGRGDMVLGTVNASSYVGAQDEVFTKLKASGIPEHTIGLAAEFGIIELSGNMTLHISPLAPLERWLPLIKELVPRIPRGRKGR